MSILSRLLSPSNIKNPASIILNDGSEIAVHFKKLAQSKSFRMRLAKDGNSIIVTMPLHQSYKAALQFANTAKDWVENQISKQTDAISFHIGGDIPIFGKKTILQIAPPRTKMVLLRNDDIQTLIIGSKPENFPEKVKSGIKKLAYDAALTHLEILKPKLLKVPSKIRVTDTKSRWGSCTHDGVISLCFRLALAPPDVFHYVIAHELAHLKEMNHSRNFWLEVERLMPNHAKHKLWLKKNGIMLHRIGF